MDDQPLIELLGAGHDRNAFDCGVPPLNDFLQRRAGQEMARGGSTTYVLVPADDRTRILGYYSIASTGVSLDDFPEDVQRKLTRYPLVPATLLARLARRADLSGMRIGERLLIDALRKCADISGALASAAVVVDAKDTVAAAFYARYGFRPLNDGPLRLFMPMREVRKIF